jgi:membrane protein implicated in regulation of membrane protease activity
MRAAPGLLSKKHAFHFFPAGVVMGIWIVWLIVAAVLGVAELVTMTLALGLIAVGAVAAAGVGAAGGNGALQFAAFIVASLAGIGVVRPIAMRHIKQPPLLRSGTSALVGRSAVVVEEVTAHAGQVKIGGELWSSRPYDETLTIPVGRTVDVMLIEGATALVYPRE